MTRGDLRFVAVCLTAIVVVVFAVDSAEACKRRASRRARRAAACCCEVCRPSAQEATGSGDVPPPPGDDSAQSPSDVPAAPSDATPPSDDTAPAAPSDETPSAPTEETSEQPTGEAPSEQPAEEPEVPSVDAPESPPAEATTPGDEMPQPAESHFPLTDDELRDLYEGLPPAPREEGDPAVDEQPPSAKPPAEIRPLLPLLDEDALQDLFEGLPPAPREEADPDVEPAPPIDPPPALEEPRTDDPFGGASATEPVMRLWHDDTGKYQVRARLVGKREDAVELEKASGRTVVVPLRRLSDDDVLYVSRIPTGRGAKNPRIVAQ